MNMRTGEECDEAHVIDEKQTLLSTGGKSKASAEGPRDPRGGVGARRADDPSARLRVGMVRPGVRSAAELRSSPPLDFASTPNWLKRIFLNMNACTGFFLLGDEQDMGWSRGGAGVRAMEAGWWTLPTRCCLGPRECSPSADRG